MCDDKIGSAKPCERNALTKHLHQLLNGLDAAESNTEGSERVVSTISPKLRRAGCRDIEITIKGLSYSLYYFRYSNPSQAGRFPVQSLDEQWRWSLECR